MSNDTLSVYGSKFEEAVVGYLVDPTIGNENGDRLAFFLEAQRLDIGQYVSNPKGQYFVYLVQKLFAELQQNGERRLPTLAEIKTRLFAEHLKQETRNEYATYIMLARQSAGEYGFKWICRTIDKWIKQVAIAKLIKASADKYQVAKGDPEKLINTVTQFLNEQMVEINNVSFLGDDTYDFKNYRKTVDAHREQMENCLTLGSLEFDLLLNQNAKIEQNEEGYNPETLMGTTRGCLAKGDTTVVLGPSNSGKTTFMTTIVATNAALKKDILYITHEQKDYEHGMKLLQCLAGLKKEDIVNNIDLVDQVKSSIEAASQLLSEHVKYIHYVKPGHMYVERVSELILKHQQNHILQKGKGFDLVVVDYPAKLQSQAFQFRKSSGWEEKMYIYQQFQLLAETEGFHMILPVQANREGLKKNKSGEVLGMGDFAESAGIAHVAYNIISINRSDEDKARNMIRFFIDKSRGSETGKMLISHTDFARSRTHGWGLLGKISNSQEESADKALFQSVIDANKSAQMALLKANKFA